MNEEYHGRGCEYSIMTPNRFVRYVDSPEVPAELRGSVVFYLGRLVTRATGVDCVVRAMNGGRMGPPWMARESQLVPLEG